MMSIKDAYEIINLVPTDKNVTEDLIRKEFNKQSLKALRNEALLKLYIKSQSRELEPGCEELIHEAYECLLNVLRHNPVNMTKEDISHKKEFLFGIHNADMVSINKYLLLFNIFDITKQYTKKINSYTSLISVYELMQNYKKEYDNLADNFKYLENTNGINYTVDNYQELIGSEELYKHLLLWLDGKFSDDFDEYTKMRDGNMDILPLMIERCKRAYELSIKTHLAKKASVIGKVNYELENTEKENRVSLILAYNRMLTYLDEEINTLLKSYELYGVMTKNLSMQYVSSELVLYFHNKIKNLLDQNQLKALDDSVLYDKTISALVLSESQLSMVKSKFKNYMEESREDILRILKIKFKKLQELNSFACTVTKDELMVHDDEKAEALFRQNDLIDDAINEGKLKVIKMYFRVILYYHAKYKDITKMPQVLYDCYKDALDNPKDKDKVNMAYELMLRVYGNVSQKMDISELDNYVTINSLMDNIEELYKLLFSDPQKVPNEIASLYSKRKTLDSVLLYDLYMTLDKLYENKFVRIFR